jgi:hypothetical protein
MKLKFFLLLLILLFVQTVIAQSVVVTSKKITYTRPKPLSDDKKTFTVTYPQVKAANFALSKKIETSISFEKNLPLNLTEEMSENQQLEEADYNVDFNNNGILSIMLSASAWGAYPATANINVVVDLKTGNKIKPGDVFTNLTGLIAKIKIMQKKDIKEGIKVIKEDPDFQGEDTAELFKNADFKVSNLEGFAVSGKGVAFNYNYGFPHVIQALEPDGYFFLSWKEMKPFIKRGSVFAKFVR